MSDWREIHREVDQRIYEQVVVPALMGDDSKLRNWAHMTCTPSGTARMHLHFFGDGACPCGAEPTPAAPSGVSETSPREAS